MRCVFLARNSINNWGKSFFPDIDVYLLKIVNKPLVEYFIDLASLLKATQMRIISDYSVKELEAYFQNGARWGVDISYSLVKEDDSLQQIYLKNYSYCKDEDLLIFNGFYFIEYNKDAIQEYFSFLSNEPLSIENGRIQYIPRGFNITSPPNVLKASELKICIDAIDNISDYYSLSMKILQKMNRNFVLPGYSNEKDAFYGISIIFPRSSKISKPIMIGNNVRFREDTDIGPNAIIGDNVIVDVGTTISNTIIYENTYIGRDLELIGKIVYKNHLISGMTGDFIQLTDDVLVRQVDKTIFTSSFDLLIQKLLTVVLIGIFTIPWLVLNPIVVVSSGKKRRDSFFISRTCREIFLTDPSKIKPWFLTKLYLHLALDKYILLWIALFGGIKLVGNHIFHANVFNRKLIRELPMYLPGAISLVESIENPNKQIKDFYELEYINKYSALYNVKILMRFLLQRLVYGFKQ